MKHIISDIWLGIRKSPFLFFFIFIQIVITSVVLYSMLATYYWTDERSNTTSITWGDKEYLKFVSLPGNTRSSLIYKGDYTHARTEHEKQEILKFYYQIDGFFNEIKEDPDITVLICEEYVPVLLYEPKEWDEKDKSRYGSGILYNENSTFHPFDNVKSLLVSSNYLDYFDVKLSEGEYFKEEDFLYEGDCIPVLMGSIYKKYYKIGDEFEGMLDYRQNNKFKVIGFIAENQYFSIPAAPSDVYRYDNHIIVPYIEKDLDGCIAVKRSNLFTSRFKASFYVCDSQKLDEVKERIQAALDKNDLSDMFYTQRARVQKELASNYADRLSISVAVCVATMIFSLFSIVFSMLYKIDENIKNYAIRMVVGETYGNITFRYLFESFVLFFLGQLTGFFVFRIYSVYTFLNEGYAYLEEPTLKTGIIINSAFYIVTAVILAICVNVKLRTYSLATLIRGSEVKRERRTPLYRAVIAFMLAIVGVFGMFIASYNVATARIDIYYTGYLTKNVMVTQISKINDPDRPETDIKLDFDIIGANAENAVIFRQGSTRYRGDDYIQERGVYFNGYIDPVNILEGRFFTSEETVDGKGDTAVVGKEIYNKYVTFDEEGNAYYYSDYLDMKLRVIGVMGKEDKSTALDYFVFTPIKTMISVLGPEGSYYLDGKSAAAVEQLEKAFTDHASQTSEVSSYKFTPRLTVGAPTDILLMLLVIIIINAMVFCFYYVSKQSHIHGVKKIIGYSKTMILTDTFTDFLMLSVGAFVAGNAIVILLKETLFSKVELFSIYMLDPVVILISLAAIILLTVFFSVVAVTKTFTAGNTNEYRA